LCVEYRATVTWSGSLLGLVYGSCTSHKAARCPYPSTCCPSQPSRLGTCGLACDCCCEQLVTAVRCLMTTRRHSRLTGPLSSTYVHYLPIPTNTVTLPSLSLSLSTHTVTISTLHVPWCKVNVYSSSQHFLASTGTHMPWHHTVLPATGQR